jgi:Protein of unknown function (DUF3313)
MSELNPVQNPFPLRWPLYALLCIAPLWLDACSTTIKEPIKNTANINCGLLGPDCGSLLSVGGKNQINLLYANPSAQWTNYTQVYLAPITYWGGNVSTVSAQDQQKLVDYADKHLRTVLSQNVHLVQRPGPGVLRIDFAITDAKFATPVLRTISMLYLPAHVLADVDYWATGSFPFTGGLKGEIKISDSLTGEVLFEGIDLREGGGSLSTAFQWQWGDAEYALDDWNKSLATHLSSWMSGASKP